MAGSGRATLGSAPTEPSTPAMSPFGGTSTRCRPGGVREHTCDVRCYTLVSIGGPGRSPVQPRFRLVEPNRSSSQVSSACFPGLLIRGMRFSSVAARAWSQGLLTSRSRFRLKLSRTGAHVARSGMFAALLRRLAATRTGAPRHPFAGQPFIARSVGSAQHYVATSPQARRSRHTSGDRAGRTAARGRCVHRRILLVRNHKTDIASTRRKKRPLSKLDMPRSRPRRRAKISGVGRAPSVGRGQLWGGLSFC